MLGSVAVGASYVNATVVVSSIGGVGPDAFSLPQPRSTTLIAAGMTLNTLDMHYYLWLLSARCLLAGVCGAALIRTHAVAAAERGRLIVDRHPAAAGYAAESLWSCLVASTGGG